MRSAHARMNVNIAALRLEERAVEGSLRENYQMSRKGTTIDDNSDFGGTQSMYQNRVHATIERWIQNEQLS